MLKKRAEQSDMIRAIHDDCVQQNQYKETVNRTAVTIGKIWERPRDQKQFGSLEKVILSNIVEKNNLNCRFEPIDFHKGAANNYDVTIYFKYLSSIRVEGNIDKERVRAACEATKANPETNIPNVFIIFVRNGAKETAVKKTDEIRPFVEPVDINNIYEFVLKNGKLSEYPPDVGGVDNVASTRELGKHFQSFCTPLPEEPQRALLPQKSAKEKVSTDKTVQEEEDDSSVMSWFVQGLRTLQKAW